MAAVPAPIPAPLDPTSITDLRVRPSNPNLLEIWVGDEQVAALPARDAEALRLRIGIAWTPPLADAIEAARRTVAAREAALKLLGRRAWPTAVLCERLTRNGHAVEAARRAVEQLVDDGWVDDAAMARDVANEVVRREPAAAEFIARKVEQRGFDAELADTVARELLEGIDPIDAAMTLARRRREAARDATPATAARRIAAALARRGFDDDTIAITLNRLDLDDAE